MCTLYLPTDFNKYWAIDIEADSLTPTVIWCMVAINCGTRECRKFTGLSSIREFIQSEKQAGSKFVGHNIIGYDAPSLNRIAKTNLTISDLVDTMVMSMVYSPSFEGGHSLDNWGTRLGMLKGKFNDFSKYTPEMMAYCEQDTRICCEVFVRMVKRMQAMKFTEDGLDIEHRAWQIIQKQHNNGFWFNAQEAHVLYGKLRAIENDLQEKIYEFWPPVLEVVGEYKRPRKKDGNPTENFKRHSEQYVSVRLRNDRDTYEVLDYVYFNIGSPAQRIEKLLALGWKPREFTKPSKTHPNGQPKATEKGQLTPSLVEFVEESGKEEVRLIAQWIEYNSRASMINTWLEAYNENTGCIHGSLWMANTLRYRHSNPNSANIPGVRHDKNKNILRGTDGVFTYESRALWGTRDPVNRRLVGVDAKGIQLRVLAHYLNNDKFTDSVLSEDPHEANKETFGFESRSLTKTITYAILMGAGDNRIARESKTSIPEAKKNKTKFFTQIPEIPKLIKHLKKELETNGRISLCDGTPIMVSSPHMVIPYLLQGDESRIMKKALIIIDQLIRKEKISALQVGMIHDELQFDVEAKSVGKFKDICYEAFRQAGRAFDYRLPIDGEVSVGATWSETH